MSSLQSHGPSMKSLGCTVPSAETSFVVELMSLACECDGFEGAIRLQAAQADFRTETRCLLRFAAQGVAAVRRFAVAGAHMDIAGANTMRSALAAAHVARPYGRR